MSFKLRFDDYPQLKNTIFYSTCPGSIQCTYVVSVNWNVAQWFPGTPKFVFDIIIQWFPPAEKLQRYPIAICCVYLASSPLGLARAIDQRGLLAVWWLLRIWYMCSNEDPDGCYSRIWYPRHYTNVWKSCTSGNLICNLDSIVFTNDKLQLQISCF